MDKDYGRRAKRKPSRAEVATLGVGAAVALAVVLAILIGGWRQHAAEIAREAPYWSVAGAPCPALNGPPPAGPAATETFDYADVGFARAYGHVSCALATDRGSLGLISHPTCQFTSPDVLKITTAKGVAWFLPGPGRPATVTTAGGIARCVLNSNFR